MKPRFIIAGAAVPYLIIIGIVAVILYFLYPWVVLIPSIMFLFVMYFFRNPPRRIPSETGIFVSPADGTVMSVNEVYEDRFLKEKAIKVTIFLSVFNVHLNRAPIDGVVKFQSYRPGQMIPAFKSHASEVNERNYVGIENGNLRIMVIQITGFIARRIVSWVRIGDKLSRGDIFGMIKFGSCTELVMPLNVEILVEKGQKLKGGVTVIGRLKNEP